MDIETRRRKQQELIMKAVERKVRLRARQLYEIRGEVDGHALQDWIQAESEILEHNAVANLYRRRKTVTQQPTELSVLDACETLA